MLDTYVRRLSTQRWLARAPRIATTVAFGLLALAGLRMLVAGPPTTTRQASQVTTRDIPAEALAESFAHDYLTWDGGADAPTAGALAAIEPPRPPRGERQRVTWTTVSSVEHRGSRATIVVRAQTTNGPVSLAVTVARTRSGTRTIAGQPAVVGSAPASGAPPSRSGRLVADPELETTVERALRNYLGRDATDLSADLARGARAAPPDATYRLRSLDELTWVAEGSRVAASVRVVDRSRVEQALRYELAVVRVAGRWLIRAVQTQSTTEVTP